MTTHAKSIINYGSDGITVEIECHLANSLPSIVIVGAASRIVSEAKERIRGAFSSAGLVLPRKRISINLAPVDTPKDSSGLDLAIAVAIMTAGSQCNQAAINEAIFIGELGLDGSVRPVRGIIGILLSGRARGFTRFYIPAGNLPQANLVPGIELIGLESLSQLAGHLCGENRLQWLASRPTSSLAAEQMLKDDGPGLDSVVGNAQAKRALAIAAAGGHNLLLSGPPGTGKSLLAKSLISLLPGLSHNEMLEVTQLHSLSSPQYDQLVIQRPVRSPHHSTGYIAVIGGGSSVRPGEVSLAHRGVLLFDELPEFSRETIEALRQPLQDRTVTISRSKQQVIFPANFIFVATANPCPCGFYGTSTGCECPAYVAKRYQQKISGPVLDRIDLLAAVEQVDYQNLLHNPADSLQQIENSMGSIKQLVFKARECQAERFQTGSKLNSDMDGQAINQYARPSPHTKLLYDQAAQRLNLSARAYMRSLAVARTIADLDGSEHIEPPHISEALFYRQLPAPP